MVMIMALVNCPCSAQGWGRPQWRNTKQAETKSAAIVHFVPNRLVRFPNCHKWQLGLQYPKNSQIFLCVLPQHSFGHALEKGDDNWIGRCLNLRLSFGCTPVESLSAELQPFYGHLRFCEVASDFVDSIQVGFEMDFPDFSTVFVRIPYFTSVRRRFCEDHHWNPQNRWRLHKIWLF